MSDTNQTRVNEDFLIILRTIVSFLDNHNFKNTLSVLNNECNELGLRNLDHYHYEQKETGRSENANKKSAKKSRTLTDIPSCLKLKSEYPLSTTKKPEQLSHEPSYFRKKDDQNYVCQAACSKKKVVRENSKCGHCQASRFMDKLNDDGTDDELFTSNNESEDYTPRQSDIFAELCQICDIDSERAIKFMAENRQLDSPYFTSSETILMQEVRAPHNSANMSSCNMNNCPNLIREAALKSEQTKLTKSSSSAIKHLPSTSFDNSSLDQYDNLKEKYLTLQDEHRRLMDITAKLTIAFRRNIKGQTDNMNLILNNCKDICPELFCSKTSGKTKNCFTVTKEEVNQTITQEVIDLSRKDSTGSSSFSTDTFDESGTADVKQVEELPADIPSNFQLDFHKLKSDLRNGETNIKLALLQALRWRITRNPACIRTEVMGSYEQYDLLDVRNCSHRNDQISYPKSTNFLDSFYCHKRTPHILQESIARLINAIASMKTGRDYLTRQSILTNYLLSIFLGTHNMKPKLDSTTRDMTIATLQKMSLRYWQRVTMINAGLCKYMVKFVSENYKKLSSYCLEYSTALLMNLWLHIDAREKCRPIVKDIIKLLATLLDTKYENCLPYVNGSLYSLLPDPSFHKVAKDVKLGQIIEYRIPAADADMQEQLRCILKIYHDPSNWQPMCDCDMGVEIENEIDLFEPELDDNDNYFTTGLSGEQLLYNYRLLFPLNGSQVCSTNVIFRPMTPLSQAKRTSFSVTPMSPYVKDENTMVIHDSIISFQYQQLKDFLINKLADEALQKDMYFKSENESVNDNNGSSNKDSRSLNGNLRRDNGRSKDDNRIFNKDFLRSLSADCDSFDKDNETFIKSNGNFNNDNESFIKLNESINEDIMFSNETKSIGTSNITRDILSKNYIPLGNEIVQKEHKDNHNIPKGYKSVAVEHFSTIYDTEDKSTQIENTDENVTNNEIQENTVKQKETKNIMCVDNDFNNGIISVKNLTNVFETQIPSAENDHGNRNQTNKSELADNDLKQIDSKSGKNSGKDSRSNIPIVNTNKDYKNQNKNTEIEKNVDFKSKNSDLELIEIKRKTLKGSKSLGSLKDYRSNIPIGNSSKDCRSLNKNIENENQVKNNEIQEGKKDNKNFHKNTKKNNQTSLSSNEIPLEDSITKEINQHVQSEIQENDMKQKELNDHQRSLKIFRNECEPISSITIDYESQNKSTEKEQNADKNEIHENEIKQKEPKDNKKNTKKVKSATKNRSSVEVSLLQNKNTEINPENTEVQENETKRKELTENRKSNKNKPIRSVSEDYSTQIKNKNIESNNKDIVKSNDIQGNKKNKKKELKINDDVNKPIESFNKEQEKIIQEKGTEDEKWNENQIKNNELNSKKLKIKGNTLIDNEKIIKVNEEVNGNLFQEKQSKVGKGNDLNEIKRKNSSKNRLNITNKEENVSKDKNNNKNKKSAQLKIERELCEDTLQYYHKPSKNAIFDPSDIKDIIVHAPTKQEAYEKRNSTAPNSPFYPVGSSDCSKSCPATARGVEHFSETLHVHPVHLHPHCYRQNYQSVCYCKLKKSDADDSKNNKVNRYACCCYDKLKQSFERDHNNENNIRNLSPIRNQHAGCNINCKYANDTNVEPNNQTNERVYVDYNYQWLIYHLLATQSRENDTQTFLTGTNEPAMQTTLILPTKSAEIEVSELPKRFPNSLFKMILLGEDINSDNQSPKSISNVNKEESEFPEGFPSTSYNIIFDREVIDSDQSPTSLSNVNIEVSESNENSCTTSNTIEIKLDNEVINPDDHFPNPRPSNMMTDVDEISITHKLSPLPENSPTKTLLNQPNTNSGVSSQQLDETDYDAVFESRPRILRTP